MTLLLEAIMRIWDPLIGEILKCKQEPTNEVDKDAVAIMRSNSLGKESVVGHIPQIFLDVPHDPVHFN